MLRAGATQDRASRHPDPASAGARRIVLLFGLSLMALGALGGCRREPAGSLGPEPAQALHAADTPVEVSRTPEGPPKDVPTPEGMVWIPGGTFWMGADDGSMKDAGPVHEVNVDGFWMDRTEVTNHQFTAFVAATGYVTVAERRPDPRDFPDVAEEKLVPGSLVFTPPVGEVSLDNPLAWWRFVPGADWKHPEGPETSIERKDDHPVVQVCWDDAMAYARWAGKRLPTEAEWEYAARGGNPAARYGLLDDVAWYANDSGNRHLDSEHLWDADMQKYQSEVNEDQRKYYKLLSDNGDRPHDVAGKRPNAFGLFDTLGNVWEWCSDWFDVYYYKSSPNTDPAGPASGEMRVLRGGSYLGSPGYVTASFRYGIDPKLRYEFVGTRCVLPWRLRARQRSAALISKHSEGRWPGQRLPSLACRSWKRFWSTTLS